MRNEERCPVIYVFNVKFKCENVTNSYPKCIGQKLKGEGEKNLIL